MEGIENDELIGDEVGWGRHKVRLKYTRSYRGRLSPIDPVLSPVES